MKRLSVLLIIFSVCLFSLTLTSCKRRKTETNNTKSSVVTTKNNSTNNATSSKNTTTQKTYEKLSLEEFIEAFDFTKYNSFQQSYDEKYQVQTLPYVYYVDGGSYNVIYFNAQNGKECIKNDELGYEEIIFDAEAFKDDLKKELTELTDDEINKIVDDYFVQNVEDSDGSFIVDENGCFVSREEYKETIYVFYTKIGEGYLERTFEKKGNIYTQDSYIYEAGEYTSKNFETIIPIEYLNDFYNAFEFDNVTNTYMLEAKDLSEEVLESLNVSDKGAISFLFNEDKTINKLIANFEIPDSDEPTVIEITQTFGYDEIEIDDSEFCSCKHIYDRDYNLYRQYYSTNVCHFHVCDLCYEYIEPEEHTYNSDRICTVCGYKEKKILDFTVETENAYNYTQSVGVKFVLDPITETIIDLDNAQTQSMRIVRTTYQLGGRDFEREYNDYNGLYKILFNHAEEDIADTNNMKVTETLKFYDISGEEDAVIKEKTYEYTVCKHSANTPVTENLPNCIKVSTETCEFCNKVLNISVEESHDYKEESDVQGCVTTITHTCNNCSNVYKTYTFNHEFVYLDCDINETFIENPVACKASCSKCSEVYDAYIENVRIYEEYHTYNLLYKIDGVVYSKMVGFFGMNGEAHTFNDENRCRVCGCYNPNPDIQISETETINPIYFDPKTNNFDHYDFSCFGEEIELSDGVYVYGNVDSGNYAKVTHIEETDGCNAIEAIVIEIYNNNEIVYRYGEEYSYEDHDFEELLEICVLENGLHIAKLKCINDGCEVTEYQFAFNHELTYDTEWIEGTCDQCDVLRCLICEEVIYNSTPYKYHYSEDENHTIEVLHDDSASVVLYQCENCAQFCYYAIEGFSFISGEEISENHTVRVEQSSNYTLTIDTERTINGDFINEKIIITLVNKDDSNETEYILETVYPNAEVLEDSTCLYEDGEYNVFVTPSGNTIISVNW